MQMSKFIQEHEPILYLWAYVEHEGALYMVSKIDVGDKTMIVVASLFRYEKWKVNVDLVWDLDMCDFEGVTIGDDYYLAEDLEKGLCVHHNDYLGFQIAVELVKAGWSAEQIAKVKRFADEQDILENESAIMHSSIIVY